MDILAQVSCNKIAEEIGRDMRREEKRKEEKNASTSKKSAKRTNYLFVSSESYPLFQLIISFESEFSARDN